MPDALDPQTADFYRRYAAQLDAHPESSRSAMLPVIERTLPRGSRVLDVGAGAGRDVAGMLAAGLDAYGIEPNAAMREQAARQFPGGGAAAGMSVLISLPEQRDGSLGDGRDRDGRNFVNHSPARLASLLAARALTRTEHAISDGVLEATGTRWHTMVFRA